VAALAAGEQVDDEVDRGGVELRGGRIGPASHLREYLGRGVRPPEQRGRRSVLSRRADEVPIGPDDKPLEDVPRGLLRSGETGGRRLRRRDVERAAAVLPRQRIIARARCSEPQGRFLSEDVEAALVGEQMRKGHDEFDRCAVQSQEPHSDREFLGDPKPVPGHCVDQTHSGIGFARIHFQQ
jgi:hypothetical protein